MPQGNDTPLRNEPGMDDGKVTDVQETSEATPQVQDLTASKLDAKLEALVNGQAEAKVLGRFAADPEIRKILEARQQGKKVSVSFDEPRETIRSNEPAEKIEWDTLTNAQMAEKLPGVMTNGFKEMLKEVTGPLMAEIENLKAQNASVQTDRISQQIKTTADKYKDFDLYRNEMVQLSNQHTTLNAEQLYVMAKLQKGKLNLNGEQPTVTERPSNNSSKPPVGKDFSKITTSPGKRRFADVLDAVLANKEFKVSEDD